MKIQVNPFIITLFEEDHLELVNFKEVTELNTSLMISEANYFEPATAFTVRIGITQEDFLVLTQRKEIEYEDYTIKLEE